MSPQQEHWHALMQSMGELEQELLAIAPESDLARADALRYLNRLLRYALGHYVDRGGSPVRPRLNHDTPRVGGDNPDYRYCTADLDGRLRYRVSGYLHEASFLGIGTYVGELGTAGGLRGTGYFTVDKQQVDAAGRFEVILSAEPNAGAWLPMAEETSSLLVRQLLLDPLRHRPAELTIECLSEVDTPSVALSTDAVNDGMHRARLFLEGTVRQFIGWTAAFMQAPNSLGPTDPALLGKAQGDPGTHYYNGYYRLQPGEALVVEFVPPPCDYWNLQACNHWLESLDIRRQPAHINHYLARPDGSGRVRAVIAPDDPGVENWMDTVGHREGCLAMRWVGMAQGHVPPPLQCQVLPLSQLGN